MMKGVFVTATGTGAGKTTVSVALARALRARRAPVVALKPIETGVDSHPLDALALAEACGDPPVANHPAWYRARAPLSPYAASLEGEPAPDLPALAAAARSVADSRLAIVEGAGGLLVPLDRASTIADLAALLGLPLLLVAPDRLGVLSDALAVVEAARRRPLPLLAVVLSRVADPRLDRDPSPRTNARILRELLAPTPVFAVDHGGALPAQLVDRVLSLRG